jgi:hypothetical protein
MKQLGTGAIAVPSPFAERKDQARLEKGFLELFDLCVETSDEREEAWAHEKLLAFYTGTFTSDGQADFFEALLWASSVSGAELPW